MNTLLSAVFKFCITKNLFKVISVTFRLKPDAQHNSGRSSYVVHLASCKRLLMNIRWRWLSVWCMGTHGSVSRVYEMVTLFSYCFSDPL